MIFLLSQGMIFLLSQGMIPLPLQMGLLSAPTIFVQFSKNSRAIALPLRGLSAPTIFVQFSKNSRAIALPLRESYSLNAYRALVFDFLL
jgi:hypothetical protein